jgi:hypothetical protein
MLDVAFPPRCPAELDFPGKASTQTPDAAE